MTQNDRAEINALIAASEQRMKVKRLPDWLKGSLALTIVLAGSGFVVHSYIPAQIGSQTSSIVGDVASLKSDVGTIKSDVTEIRNDIKNQLTKALDSARQKIRNGGAPEEFYSFWRCCHLRAAKDFNVELGPDVVREYGNALIEIAASPSQPSKEEAWIAAMALASYRSSFAQVPRDPDDKPFVVESGDGASHYTFRSPVNESKPFQSAVQLAVPKEKAAVITPLGVDLNPDKNAGNPLTFLDGGSIILDGFRFRNVVMRNVHVVYQGMPVQLENVTFLNCRFSVDNTQRGRDFTSTSIAMSLITFSPHSRG